MSLLDCQCPILLLGYCQMYHKVCDPLSQPFHNILILSDQFQSPATAVLLKSDIIFPTSVAFPQSVKKFRDYINFSNPPKYTWSPQLHYASLDKAIKSSSLMPDCSKMLSIADSYEHVPITCCISFYIIFTKQFHIKSQAPQTHY